MKDLARAGRQRGRWSAYRKAMPDWFRRYVDLETDASEIRWYQAEVVEVGLQDDAVALRDSKNPTGPVLSFPAAEWRAFVAAVRADAFTTP